MNEEYLKGYFNSYVKSQKADADYNDWVSKISNNNEYKQNMFNTHVKPQKPDADYNDWNTKIFGTSQQVEQKKIRLKRLLRKFNSTFNKVKDNLLNPKDNIHRQLQIITLLLIGILVIIAVK